MKIGDYVRFNRGGVRIARLIENINNSEFWKLDIHQDILENDIIKSSPNIIDLIEVGDYVDGIKVNDVYSPDGKNVFRIELEVDGLKGHIISKSEDIKSIVTKEQFESMQYNLESEVN